MNDFQFSESQWRKSSRSADTANCVEVAIDHDSVGVRDSKSPDDGVLVFSARRWLDFVGFVGGEDS